MNTFNLLFTLNSLTVILVTLERYSFTTRILLNPYGFLRLHELVQITTLILFTVIIPFFILRLVTSNFDLLKSTKGFLLGLLFIIGIYFYATGNGIHELSSFNFNQFCNVTNFQGSLCGSFFINDYYTGNILYFLGAALTIIPLLLFQKINPTKSFTKVQLAILLINSLVYAFTIFAYAGLDRVIVGLIYSSIMALITLAFFLSIRSDFRRYPVITYNAFAYILGTIAALLVRFH